MGDGVRELEDSCEGEEVIDPSSDTCSDNIPGSDSISASIWRRERGGGRVAPASAAAARRGGRVAVLVETRCLGARGGLLAAG